VVLVYAADQTVAASKVFNTLHNAAYTLYCKVYTAKTTGPAWHNKTVSLRQMTTSHKQTYSVERKRNTITQQTHRPAALILRFAEVLTPLSQSMFCPPPPKNVTFFHSKLLYNSASFTLWRIKYMCQKWKIKLIFQGAYRLSGTGTVECLEIIDVGCNLRVWRLDLTDPESPSPQILQQTYATDTVYSKKNCKSDN